MMIEDAIINGLTEGKTYLVLVIPQSAFTLKSINNLYILLTTLDIKMHKDAQNIFILIKYTDYFHKVPASLRCIGCTHTGKYKNHHPLSLDVVDVIYNEKGEWNYDWWKPKPSSANQ